MHAPVPTAAERRDAVLTRMAETGTWASRAMRYVVMTPSGFEGTAEEFRMDMLRRGCPEPDHPNAWGALFSTAVKRDHILFTGEYRAMKSAKSHARRTAVYVRAGGLS